ncbi:MAG: hypothetical protein ACRD20_17715 [Terriglobales bacterium]
MAFPSRVAVRALILCLLSVVARAGGPLVVGGPAVGGRPRFGVDGKPFTWDPAKMPIAYRVDPGPMSVNPSGTVVINHSAGLQRVQGMFGVWQAVSTANVSFTNAGALLPAGSYTGGDLNTAQQFNDIIASCRSGAQSPVIFDADGKLMASLGLPSAVIGFNSGCALDASSGTIVSSAIVLNGEFQDKVQTSGTRVNYELSQNSFDEAITHEIGHFLGLDHSQINLNLLFNPTLPCDLDELAGLPLMFPVLLCQARKDAGLPVLSHDELAWISSFYPNASTIQNFGTITGTIFFADGVSAAQGANVIARLVDDPSTPQDESRRVAVSAVSGYLFTGNPGQSVTSGASQNTNGSVNGSRNPALIGFYQIALPPGTYTVEIESIYYAFSGGSGVGPINPPAPTVMVPEFWNTEESAFDFPLQRDYITVHAGEHIDGIDIIMNLPLPRFDQNEDSGRLLDAPVVLPFARPEDVIA